MKQGHKLRYGLMSTSILVCLSAISPARAQASDSPGAGTVPSQVAPDQAAPQNSANVGAPGASAISNAGSTAETGLQEVVVTARKRTEAIITSPIADTAITASVLAEKGIEGFRELNSFVPGFHWETQNTSNATRIFNNFIIRGVNAGDTPERGAVSVFIDGVSVGGANSIPGLEDVSEVEVVKGPQAAYFGRATFAGAVNFTTASPSFTPKESVDLSAGSSGQEEFRGAIEGPVLDDKISGRLSVRHWESGSYADNYGYGGSKLGNQTTDSVALSLLIKPVDKLSVRIFSTMWQDDDGPNATEYLYNKYDNCSKNPSVAGLNYICGQLSGLVKSSIAQNPNIPQSLINQLITPNPAAGYIGDSVLGAGFIDRQGLERHAQFNTASFDYSLPLNFSLDGNVGYVRDRFGLIQDSLQRFDTTPNQYGINLTAWDLENQLGEVRVSSDQSRFLRGMLGLDYYHQIASVDAYTFVSTNGVGSPSLNLARSTNTRNVAAFGSLELNLTKELEADFEGRFYSEDVTETSLVNFKSLGGTTDRFLPRAILKYSFTPSINVYASYSVGTRGATPNTNFYYNLPAATQAGVKAQLGQIPTIVPEEVIETYEVGFKGMFFDRRLRILTDVYYGQYLHRQISDTVYNPAPGVAQAIVTLADGKAILGGFEAEVNYKATDYLSFDGTFDVAETDIRRTNDSNDSAITGSPFVVGTDFNSYPVTSGAISGTYDRPVFGSYDGYLHVDFVYTGRQYADTDNIAWLAPAYVVNATVGLKRRSYTFEVWGHNIFNETTPTGVAVTGDVLTTYRAITASPQEPASVGVRVAARF